MADVGSMDTVMILKRFIHAERAGLWEKHLAEVEKCYDRAYLVAACHYNYILYLPHYLQAMGNLSTVAPNIHRAFKNGQFTIHPI